jgi:hypothetical protein
MFKASICLHSTDLLSLATHHNTYSKRSIVSHDFKNLCGALTVDNTRVLQSGGKRFIKYLWALPTAKYKPLQNVHSLPS